MKNLKISVYLLLLLCVISCKHSISVKGINGNKYYSYQECCAAGDFEAAHLYLAKMQKENSRTDINTASSYVFKQEALYLMGIGTDDARNRIIYLLKEVPTTDRFSPSIHHELVSMILDLAMDVDDESFVKRIALQYDPGEMDKEELLKLFGYLSQKPGEDNREYISSFLKKGIFDMTKNADEDVIRILIRFPDQYTSDAIIDYLVNKYKEDSYYTPSVPEGMKMIEEKRTYDSQFKAYVANNKDRHQSAIEYAQDFNDQCDLLLGLALENGNAYLAKRLVEIYQPVPCGWEEGKRSTYSRAAQINAKRRLKNAGL